MQHDHAERRPHERLVPAEQHLAAPVAEQLRAQREAERDRDVSSAKATRPAARATSHATGAPAAAADDHPAPTGDVRVVACEADAPPFTTTMLLVPFLPFTTTACGNRLLRRRRLRPRPGEDGEHGEERPGRERWLPRSCASQSPGSTRRGVRSPGSRGRWSVRPVARRVPRGRFASGRRRLQRRSATSPPAPRRARTAGAGSASSCLVRCVAASGHVILLGLGSDRRRSLVNAVSGAHPSPQLRASATARVALRLSRADLRCLPTRRMPARQPDVCRMNDVVVVGNGVSGYACAARLAERGVPVTMIGPGLPHDRPPLSKRALLTGRVPLLADAAQLAERGIEHVDGVVTACDLDRRRLVVAARPERGPLEIDGADARVGDRPALPEAADSRASSRPRRTPPATGLVSLVRRLALPGPARRRRGRRADRHGDRRDARGAHDVTLLDMLDRPLARFLPRVSEAARATLDALGVRFLGSCRIESATADATGAVVHTSTHGDIGCDVLVSAAGFRSSLLPELAGPDSRALTLAADEQLRVIGHERLWACGDCVSFPHPRWGRIAIPHWDHALWSGRHVAEAILGSTDALRARPLLLQRHRPPPHPAGRRGRGRRRVVGRRRACDRSRLCRSARLRGPTQLSGAAARGARASRRHSRTARHHPIVGGTSCPYT